MKKFFVIFGLVFVCITAFAHSVEWYVDGSLYQTTTCDAGDNITPPVAPAKYGYSFAGWALYTELEYIESTGTQYIDLGRKVRSDYTYKTKVAWTRFGPYTLMSSKEYSDWMQGKYLGIPYTDGTNKAWYSRSGTDTDYGTIKKFNATANTIYDIDWNPTSHIDINGTTYTNEPGSHQQTSDVFETANNMYLFAANSDGTATGMDYVKLYSWQMYDTDGTTLLMNLIPAKRISDNVLGMYDTVSGQFFTNAGAGEFIAGPEVGGL